jgi:hypothetical protein
MQNFANTKTVRAIVHAALKAHNVQCSYTYTDKLRGRNTARTQLRSVAFMLHKCNNATANAVLQSVQAQLQAHAYTVQAHVMRAHFATYSTHALRVRAVKTH